MTIEVGDETLDLLPEKGIWIPSIQALILADLHFGKINHFRRAGIVVPPKVNDKNAEELINLLNRFNPKRLLFLGDLFHSHYNDEWEVLGQIRAHFITSDFELIVGNHDILSRLQYERIHMKIHDKTLNLGKLIFSHEPLKEIPDGYYNLCGHIHPAVSLRGSAKQSLTLPCFYFGKRNGILPAFGSFTGLARIIPQKGERVFVIAENNLLEIRDTSELLPSPLGRRRFTTTAIRKD